MSFKALRNLGKLAAGQQDVEEIWADRHSVVNSWPLVVDLPKHRDLLLKGVNYKFTYLATHLL